MSVVSDSLDDILGESGDEEEQDAVITQVLDEIGIEISGKVCLSVWQSVVRCSNNVVFVTCMPAHSVDELADQSVS